MINKNNERISITVPKWILESLKARGNYNMSKLCSKLLRNYLNYLSQKDGVNETEQLAILKHNGFDSLEDFKKANKELVQEIIQELTN